PGGLAPRRGGGGGGGGGRGPPPPASDLLPARETENTHTERNQADLTVHRVAVEGAEPQARGELRLYRDRLGGLAHQPGETSAILMDQDVGRDPWIVNGNQPAHPGVHGERVVQHAGRLRVD